MKEKQKLKVRDPSGCLFKNGVNSSKSAPSESISVWQQEWDGYRVETVHVNA